MREPTAAQTAKRLFEGASLQLGTASPSQVRELSRVLDDSLPYPVGDPAYAAGRLLQTDFNENTSDSLGFVVDPGGPRASGLDRIAIAIKAMAAVDAMASSQHKGRRA